MIDDPASEFAKTVIGDNPIEARAKAFGLERKPDETDHELALRTAELIAPSELCFEFADMIEGSPMVGIDADGKCYFAVVPAPTFQAQLDRIEMMLQQLMPKQEKKEAPDAGFCIDYLNSVDSGNFLGITEYNGANDEMVFIVKTRRELAKDHQEWLCAQYAPHNLTFKIGW